jgi:hypothetical protein
MPASPTQTHRSFTVRVPMSIYSKITQLALESKTNMNTKVNELLELGLKENVRVEAILMRLVKRVAAEELNNDGQ